MTYGRVRRGGRLLTPRRHVHIFSGVRDGRALRERAALFLTPLWHRGSLRMTVPTALPRGTDRPTAATDGLIYTREQETALAALLDPTFELGVARAECVNKLLAPDGTLLDDASVLLAMASAALAATVTDATTTDASEAATRFERAAALSRQVGELREHLAAQRFLFIPTYDGAACVYFQCAVAHNVDVFPPAPTKVAP